MRKHILISSLAAVAGCAPAATVEGALDGQTVPPFASAFFVTEQEEDSFDVYVFMSTASDACNGEAALRREIADGTNGDEAETRHRPAELWLAQASIINEGGDEADVVNDFTLGPSAPATGPFGLFELCHYVDHDQQECFRANDGSFEIDEHEVESLVVAHGEAEMDGTDEIGNAVAAGRITFDVTASFCAPYQETLP